MKTLNTFVAALLSAALLAACSGRGALMPTGASAIPSNRLVAAATNNGGSTTLYVSGSGGTAIFAAGGAKYVRKIRPKSGAVATDRQGHLYVAGETATAVDVYENRGAKLAWTVHAKPYYPRLLVLDDSGDLYLQCGDRNLCEYGPRNKGLVRQLRGYGTLLALDTGGNLYLATGFNSVAVYAPGSTSPERTITNGIAGPEALALDLQGNLYVANAYVGSQPSQNVTVYAPGGSSPIRTITAGLTIPYAMTTDSAGNLYVLNSCVNRGGCTNDQDSVAVYSPGTNTPQHVVSQGLDFPVTLAVDRSSNLYVANNGNYPTDHGSVTVYGSGSYSLIRTVTHDIEYPGFLALGS